MLAGSEQELQHNISDLEAACAESGMPISTSKTKVIHIQKTRKSINCGLNGGVLSTLEQFEHRRVNGNKVIAQLRSHVFNKNELS